MTVVFFVKDRKNFEETCDFSVRQEMFDILNSIPLLFQSIATLPLSGESLKILARDLGSRVHTKYSVRQKHQNQMLEKLSTIYNQYTGVLAKDTKVTEQWSSMKCPLLPATSVIFCYLHTYVIRLSMCENGMDSFAYHCYFSCSLLPVK